MSVKDKTASLSPVENWERTRFLGIHRLKSVDKNSLKLCYDEVDKNKT